SANEKQDAEELSRLRQTQEIDLLDMVTEVKNRQVLEAQANLDNLDSNRTTAIQRLTYFVEELLGNQPAAVRDSPVLDDNLRDTSALPGETIINQVTSSIDVSLTGTDEAGVKVIPKEKQEMDFRATAQYFQAAANLTEALAAIITMFPKTETLVAPFGCGVKITTTDGFSWGAAASALAKVLEGASSWYSSDAGQASTMAGFIRREQD